MGPKNSTWGAVRASLGHPDPFDLHYVEVGNEDWLNGGWDTYKGERAALYAFGKNMI